VTRARAIPVKERHGRAGVRRRGALRRGLPLFLELRDWLTAAGFTAVNGYGDDAAQLTPASRRLIVTGER
jgi:hypothetical protein